MPPHLSSSKASESLATQGTFKQRVTYPHPEATVSPVLLSEHGSLRSQTQTLSSPTDNENIHINPTANTRVRMTSPDIIQSH